MDYDVIVPLGKRSIVTIKYTIDSLKKFLNPQRIIIISNKEYKWIAEDNGCLFLDENCVYDGMGIDSTTLELAKYDKYAQARAGWYLQQFIKMAYCYLCNDEYYVVWDADTIVLKHIPIFAKDGKPFFDVSTENHIPYFLTIKKLFRGTIFKIINRSFISEHMVIQRDYMIEMIDCIKEGNSEKSNHFWKVIIDSINIIDLPFSGFSEYETYGSYVSIKKEGSYRIRKHKSKRINKGVTCKDIEEMIDLYRDKFDIITLENREMPVKPQLI